MHPVRLARAIGVAATCFLVLTGSTRDASSASSDPTCTLDGTSVVSFGSYDPNGTLHLDVLGRVSYRCFKSLTAAQKPDSERDKLTVQISLSQGRSGTFDRSMYGGRDRLRYNLFLNAQRSQIWGDGTGGTSLYSVSTRPDNRVVTVPVFGRVFALQDVSADTYLDDIIVTLEF